MTRQEKSAQERLWLDFAFDRLAIKPGRVEKREAPDFLVEFDGRIVGLEVAEARDQRAAAAKGALKRLDGLLETELKKSGLNLAVWLSLDAGCAQLLEENARELRRHVAVLAELCAEHVQHGWDRREYDEAHLEQLGAGWIRRVTVWNHDEPVVVWAHRWVGGSQRWLIQAAIDAKASKLASYRAVAAEVWLLVVAGTGLGASVAVQEATGTFRSPFDRSFFLDAYEGTCAELQTQPPDP